MGKNKTNEQILLKLNQLYPDAKAELDFTNPYELLIATILSAQCTDIRVNKITRELFKVANTPEQMVALGREKVVSYIRTCGMFETKSKYLIMTSSQLISNFGSKVPGSIEELMTLPGVGRKTANVVASNAFQIPAIAVDTHVFRVANRLGLATANDVDKTERQLMENVKKERWILLHHQLIYHGRRICKARNPLCNECIINTECKYYKNNKQME